MNNNIKCLRCGGDTQQLRLSDPSRRRCNSCGVLYDYCPNCKKLFDSSVSHIVAYNPTTNKYYTECQR
jgi:hypothetical protein